MTRVLGFVSLVCLAVAGPVFAQAGAEGTIRGVVTDEQGGVLPGVTVTATSASASVPTVTVSDASGGYRLQNLVPGDYVVAAELAGFSRFERRGIIIRAGLNIVVDLTMRVGSVGETIQVVGESPMIDTAKSVQAVNISGELQRRLPLGSRRDFTEFLEVTPGVTARSFDQAAGGQVYMLRGSDIENHVTQIDGADMGSFRQNWAGQYTGLSTDAIDDVQVKTGGSDASSPLGVGVIMQIATPSGTNQLKGSAGAIYTARGWNGNNADPGGSPASVETFQPDLSAGGPLIKDKAWFFGAFRYTRRDVGIARDQKQLSDLQILKPGFEPFDNVSRSKFYYVKGTTQLTANHQLYGFYQFDRNPDTANFAFEADELEVTAFGGHGVGTRLTSIWGQALTTKLLFAWNDKSINGVDGVFDNYPGQGPQLEVFDTVTRAGSRLTGAGLLGRLNNVFQRPIQPAEKMTVSGDLTYFKQGWVGSHEIQTGVYLQPRLFLGTTTTYANGGFAVEDAVLRERGNPAAGSIPFRRRYYDVPELVTRDQMARDYGFYVQDGWKPIDRLTINAGLRLDYVSSEDRLFDVTVQDAWEVGPRFGATYALTEDRRNVVRGSVGRVHDVPNAFYLGTAGNAVAGFRDEFDLDLNGTFETVLAQPAASRVSSDRIIDPDRHQGYIDEWILGYQRQFAGQTSMDVSFVRRTYRDRPTLVETNGIYDGGVFRGYRDESQNEIGRVTNNEWNWFVYSGLELTLSKRVKWLQVLGSYTRNWQHLAGTWQPNDYAFFIQPEAFPNDRGIGTIRGDTGPNTRNSLAGDADVRSPSWQKHQARLGGVWFAPYALVVSSNYTMLSGPWTGPVVDQIAAADPQFGPSQLTLSNGRVVSNPLATTLRFAFPTRGDGQPKTPNLHIWNLRVGRDFALMDKRIELAFDIFNVTNNATDQQFKTNGNQRFSANYAIRPDGSFQGQNRQFARSGQLSVRFVF